MVTRLAVEAKHHDASIFVRRIRPDVSEVRIERNDRTSLAKACGCYVRIASATESLIENGHSIVACFTKQVCELNGRFSSNLNRMWISSRGQRRYSFLGQVGSVAYRGPNRFTGDRRVALRDFVHIQTCRQVVQDSGHQYPGARNTCPTVTDHRIDGYMVTPVHRMQLHEYAMNQAGERRGAALRPLRHERKVLLKFQSNRYLRQ